MVQASIDHLDPQRAINDPIGPVKTKGVQRSQHGFNPEWKRASRTEEKGRQGIVGSKAIFLPVVSKRKMAVHHIRGDEE